MKNNSVLGLMTVATDDNKCGELHVSLLTVKVQSKHAPQKDKEFKNVLVRIFKSQGKM
jgi:hypothetical protein